MDALEGPKPIEASNGRERCRSDRDKRLSRGQEFEVETGASRTGRVGPDRRTNGQNKTPLAAAVVRSRFCPGEAVSVTRRLYLSGESEYQLNGKTCRLRDIQDLFAGTGLSGAALRDHRTGPHRADPFGKTVRPPQPDRRSRRHLEIPHPPTCRRGPARFCENESRPHLRHRFRDREAGEFASPAGRKDPSFYSFQEEFRVLLRELFAAEGHYYSALIDDLKNGLDEATEVEKNFAKSVVQMEESFREATDAARAAEESLAQIRRQHAENALERDRANREHRYQSEQIVGLNNRLQAINSDDFVSRRPPEAGDSEIARLKIEEQKENAEADASRLLLTEAESCLVGEDRGRQGDRITAGRTAQLYHAAHRCGRTVQRAPPTVGPESRTPRRTGENP